MRGKADLAQPGEGVDETGRWIGASLARKEDDRLVRGAGRYVGDISFPGQLHATFVRSTFAHARITGIDASAALGAPGVIDVLTASDVPSGPMPPFLWDTPPEKLVAELKPMLRPCHPPLLPSDRVRFVGQAIAVVLAESRYAAEDAAALVEVDLDPLPALGTIDAALASGATIVHDGWDDNVAVRFTVRKGEVDDAIGAAHTVVSETFEMQRQAGVPMETRGAVARVDADGHLTLWSATQNAHPLRRALSRVSGLPPERVDVIAPDVGGGFGTKGVLYPEDLIVGLAVLRLGRPVKWIEDRIEHMQSAIHAREQRHSIRLAFDGEGRILALNDRFIVDTGAFNPLGLVIPYNTIAHLMGPYRVPTFEAVGTCVITTKVPTAPYRGAGRPEAVFAVERAIDRAAEGLGIDPVELRARNLLRPDELPFEVGILYRDGEPLVLDSGDYPRTLARAAELLGYEAFRAEQARERQPGRLLGLGVACYVEGTGIGPFEGASVRLDPASGAVSASTGACSQGQAHETVFAQICADALGVHPDRVSVSGGDTRELERGWGTVASRSAVVAGNAIRSAATSLRTRVMNAAAERLEAAAADLVLEGDRVVVAGAPERSVALADLATHDPDVLRSTEYFEPGTVTWANGAHAVAVEVDAETGEIAILRYAVVHDCGTVINPVVVDGQVHGGVAQGIGGAIFEEVLFDEEGQLLNATMADYLVPTATEVPPMELDHLETPTPMNPLGIKGVGEGGAVPVAAAIAGAVEDALRPFGARVRRTPLSPSAVRQLIQDAERR